MRMLFLVVFLPLIILLGFLPTCLGYLGLEGTILFIMFLHLPNLFLGPLSLVLHVPLDKVFRNFLLLCDLIKQLLASLRYKWFHLGDLFQVLDFLLLLELVFLFFSLHHLVVKLLLSLFSGGVGEALLLRFFKLSILLLLL